MTSPTSERLQFLLETAGSQGVVSDLQRIGQAGETSQTRLQQRVGETEKAFAQQGRVGGTSLAVISDGASKSTSMLGRMSERLGVTESTLRTGIATAAAVGFGMLISKAADAVNEYVELASEVRNFQRASGAGAEESSKFVAVLDDLQISAEQGSAAIGKLARVDPTKLQQFGIEVAHAKDGTVSLTETLLNVADAYARTEDPQQRALLGNAAFGRSYQQLIPLLEQGRDGLKSYFDGVSEGQILTQEQLDSTRQYELAVDNLQDSLGDLSRAAGETLVPALTAVANAGADVLNFIGDLPGPLVEAVISGGLFALTAVKISNALNAIRASRAAETLSQTSANIGQLASSAGAAEIATSKLGRTAGTLSKVGAAGAAIGASIPLLGELGVVLRGLIVEEPDINRLATALEALGTTGTTGGAFGDIGGLEGFKDSLRETLLLGEAHDNLAVKILDLGGAISSLSQGKENIDDLDQALAELVKGGSGDAAANTFKKFADAAAEQGVPIEELRKLFPEYAQAVEDAALADESGQASAEGHAGAMETARDKASKYTDAVDALTKGLEVLNGKQISLAEADIALRDSMADFTEQVKKAQEANDANATSLDRNTQTGRDNESALIDQIKAAQDYAAAVAQSTGHTKEAEKAFRTQIGSIQDNMIALGFNKDQVDALIKKYGGVPGNLSTHVRLDDQATVPLAKLLEKLRAADGEKATVKLITQQITEYSTKGQKGKATGGAVQAGTDYLVGEVRPELFRPSVPGTIVPNTGAASGSSGSSAPMMNVEGDLVVRDDRDVDRLLESLVFSSRVHT